VELVALEGTIVVVAVGVVVAPIEPKIASNPLNSESPLLVLAVGVVVVPDVADDVLVGSIVNPNKSKALEVEGADVVCVDVSVCVSAVVGFPVFVALWISPNGSSNAANSDVLLAWVPAVV